MALKKKRKQPAWEKLDNTALLFPVIATEGMSNVYRLSACMTEEIDPEALTEAQEKVLSQFLGFRMRLRAGFFWYYVEENDRPLPEVREENDFPGAYINKSRNNQYLFRITYYRKRINLEVFHALTDGFGGLVLLKELVYQYLRIKHPEILEVENISGLMVTLASMEKKKEELKHIIEVEIPKNSKEIGEAIALGDLSENAEYKFGKEKQEMLNINVKKLKNEIDKSQVFDKSKVNLNKISFGTKVTMLNLDTDKNVVYTILGPWESDPDKNIISYKAPLGIELLDSEKDEELHFEINGTQYNFKVLSIEASDLI